MTRLPLKLQRLGFLLGLMVACSDGPHGPGPTTPAPPRIEPASRTVEPAPEVAHSTAPAPPQATVETGGPEAAKRLRRWSKRTPRRTSAGSWIRRLPGGSDGGRRPLPKVSAAIQNRSSGNLGVDAVHALNVPAGSSARHRRPSHAVRQPPPTIRRSNGRPRRPAVLAGFERVALRPPQCHPSG